MEVINVVTIVVETDETTVVEIAAVVAAVDTEVAEIVTIVVETDETTVVEIAVVVAVDSRTVTIGEENAATIVEVTVVKVVKVTIMIDPRVENTKVETIEGHRTEAVESPVDGVLRTNEALVDAEIPRGVFI